MEILVEDICYNLKDHMNRLRISRIQFSKSRSYQRFECRRKDFPSTEKPFIKVNLLSKEMKAITEVCKNVGVSPKNKEEIRV